MTLDEFLSQPCQGEGCDRVATHRNGGQLVCNGHLDHSLPARALNS